VGRGQRRAPRALGDYDARVDPDGAGPRLYFQRVPEPKTAKNRMHLDLAVSGARGTPSEEARRSIAAAVERAAAAGATRLREIDEGGEHWVVLQDPEGNEFCMHGPRPSGPRLRPGSWPAPRGW
jgi:hypothetical protein